MQRLKDKRNFGEIILIPQKRGFERNFALSIHVSNDFFNKAARFFLFLSQIADSVKDPGTGKCTLLPGIFDRSLLIAHSRSHRKCRKNYRSGRFG